VRAAAPAAERRAALEVLFGALENAGDAAVAVDAAQRIVLWNRAAEALLGWPRAEALGKPCYDVLAGRDAAGNLACCSRCAVVVMAERGEPVHSRDLCYRTRDGRSLWVNISTLVLPRPQQGEGWICIHLFRDISHRRRIEDLVDALAAREGRARAEPTPLDALTRREREVLVLLARGLETRAIARTLFVSPVTVRNHVQRLLRKMGAHSRAEAVAVGVRHGLKL
jgi:PAS domain S-box-containing protein